jgi:hypothetical protein
MIPRHLPLAGGGDDVGAHSSGGSIAYRCPTHGRMGRFEDLTRAATVDALLRPALEGFERDLMEGLSVTKKESSE